MNYLLIALIISNVIALIALFVSNYYLRKAIRVLDNLSKVNK